VRQILKLSFFYLKQMLRGKAQGWPTFGITYLVGGVFFMACLDTQTVSIQELQTNAPPSIQTRSVIPQPGQNLVQVLIGTEDALCPSTDFSVPEISDLDLEDTLYYQWFLDFDATEPLRRNPLKSGTLPATTPGQLIRTLPTFQIDQEILQSNLGPINTFLGGTHILELYVSDRPYADPRFTEQNDPLVLPEGGNEDHMYWLLEMVEVNDCGGAP
jgi:hypothetical protein